MIRFSLVPPCIFISAGCAAAGQAADATSESELSAGSYLASVEVNGSAPSELRWRAGDPQPELGAADRALLPAFATGSAHAVCDVILGTSAWTTSGETEVLSTEWDQMRLGGLRYSLKVEAMCSASLPTREAFLDRLFIAAGGPGLDTPSYAVSTAREALAAQPDSAWPSGSAWVLMSYLCVACADATPEGAEPFETNASLATATPQPALDTCLSRNGGDVALGKPVNNGGGALPHAWGNGIVVDRNGGSVGANLCMQKTGASTAWNVRGAIREAYIAAGGPRGAAGYPLEDEGSRSAGGFARQRFEGGEFRHTAGRYVFEPAGPKAATESFPVACPPPGFVASKSSGPIVIDGKNDVVISGVKISNPSGPCITIRGGSRSVRVENSEIGPCYKYGVAVLDATQVSVSNNYIHDIVGNGVHVERAASVESRGNCIQRTVSAVFAQDSRFISVDRNSIRNVKRLKVGDLTDAALQEIEGLYRGQAVQFNRVSDGGSRIACNLVQNDVGLSNAEDAFNVHASNGTAQAPIDLAGNRVLGGGPSKTGGGFLIGDGGGSNQVSRGNIGVNPGQYGVAIAGGSHMSMYGNVIFGTAQPNFTNVGMYVWRASGVTPTCDDLTVGGNRIKYFSGNGQENPFWDGKNCTGAKIATNDLHAAIGADVIDTIPAECR